MDERRIPERTRTFLRGRVQFNGGQTSLDCLIRDLSESGARITLSDSVTLPEVFELFNGKTEQWRRVEVKWRRGDQLGVHYLPAAERADPTPPQAPYVRALEAEVARLKRMLEELRADPGKIQTMLDRFAR